MADVGRRRRRAVLEPWLRPGVGVKRWLLVCFGGLFLLALAGSFLLRAISRGAAIDFGEGILSILTLQALPLPVRGLFLLVVGGALLALGLWRVLGVLLEPFGRRDEPLMELIYQRRSLARGPRIVAIGGGTGQAALLRGLKESTSNITAVVAVADDGGSSGILRTELGIPPVGDIRNCIVALADTEPLMQRLLQYRFPTDPQQPGPLGGHSLGNLLIAALSAVEGDFEEGVRQSNRVLAVRGEVVPAAPVPLTLHAELADGTHLEGQSVVARARGISRVWVTPSDVRASARALEQIASADLITIGPGSLYTSLLPSLLLPDLRNALARSRALRVYVCNVATQVGETEDYRLSDHLAALDAHGLRGVIDAVIVNRNLDARAPRGYPAAPVEIDLPLGPREGAPTVVAHDVVDDENAHRHDPAKLAAAVLATYAEHVASRTPATMRRTA